jgi:hypothetical protein
MIGFTPTRSRTSSYSAIWLYTKGNPGLVAVKLLDLIRNEILCQQASDVWCLADDGPASSSFADVFYTDAYEPIRSTLVRQSDPERNWLRTFLHSAALCGPVVPINQLLEFCDVPIEERDGFIDFLDDGCDPQLFNDFGYNHLLSRESLSTGFAAL